MPIITISECPYCQHKIAADTDKQSLICDPDGTAWKPCSHLVFAEWALNDWRIMEGYEHERAKLVTSSKTLDQLSQVRDCLIHGNFLAPGYERVSTPFKQIEFVGGDHENDPDDPDDEIFAIMGSAIYSPNAEALVAELIAIAEE